MKRFLILTSLIFCLSQQGFSKSLKHYFYKKPQKNSAVVLSSIFGVAKEQKLVSTPVLEPRPFVAGLRADAYMNSAWSNSVQVLIGSGQGSGDDALDAGFVQAEYGVHKVFALKRVHFMIGPTFGYLYFFDKKDLTDSKVFKDQASAGFILGAGLPVSARFRFHIHYAYNRGLVDSAIQQQQALGGLGWML